MIGRVEVLDRVGGLLILPALEMATIQQVSDFYGVPQGTMRGLIMENKEEITSDGYTILKRKDCLLVKGTNKVESKKEMQKRKNSLNVTLNDKLPFLTLIGTTAVPELRRLFIQFPFLSVIINHIKFSNHLFIWCNCIFPEDPWV